MDIKQALKELNFENDEHWTSDGLPKISAVQELIGTEPTRQQITQADPEFNRQSLANQGYEEDADTSSDAVEESAEDSQPEMTKEELEKEKEVEALALEISNLEQKIKAGKESIKAFQDGIVAKQKSLAIAKRKFSALCPKKTNTQSIQSYLKQENKNRMIRHEERKKVLGSLSPKDFTAMSPIDAAMARKRTRGSQRPVRRIAQ